MNPISIILNLGRIIQTGKDIEHAAVDLVHKNYSKDDIKAILEDFKGLIDSGLIEIPGLPTQEIDAAITALEGVV
jgi:hypothetical protein